MSRNRPLSQSQAGRAREVGRLLERGLREEALLRAGALVKEAPWSPEIRRLAALCAARCGDAIAAESNFRQAIALAPDVAATYLDFAAWLRAQGRLAECRPWLARAPASAAVLLERGLLSSRLGEPARAVGELERAVAADPRNPVAWDGLGHALCATRALEPAEEALRKAIGLAAGYASAWFNLGVVLRLRGRIDEALACVREARRLGHAAPEVDDTLHGLLLDLGLPDEAVVGARQLVATHPAFVAGHETLAHLLWEHAQDDGDDPLAPFRAAAAAQPGHLHLQWRFVRTLVSARRPGEALDWLARLGPVAREQPMLAWCAADALDMAGRLEESGLAYARLQPGFGERLPAFLDARARHAFRRGDVALAQRCAELALQQDPFDQEAWAHLGTAWRLAGDAREHWLCDYDRLVCELEVEPPADFADGDAFLAALQERLDAMHVAGREPMSQSVRGGSQTAGRLFGRPDPIVRSAAEVLHRAVDAWVSGLPDDGAHPFLRRRRTGLRFAGSWSVRLHASGHHANHIHNEGWLSSAFYVALPPAVVAGDSSSHAGWLQLGQPMESLGLSLAPRRLIQPRPGRLVLFPSYVWHGTVPFQDPEPRLTVAFDMQPG